MKLREVLCFLNVVFGDMKEITPGVLPIMAYKGRLRLKGVLFHSSKAEVYKRVGKSVI